MTLFLYTQIDLIVCHMVLNTQWILFKAYIKYDLKFLYSVSLRYFDGLERQLNIINAIICLNFFQLPHNVLILDNDFIILKKLNCMRLMHFSYIFCFNWLIGHKYIFNWYNKSIVYLLGSVYFRFKVNTVLIVFF